MNTNAPSVDVADKIETLILLALDANKNEHDDFELSNERGKNTSTEKLSSVDAGALLHFDGMRPNSAFTFDLADRDRLFTSSPEYLKGHVSDVLGDECEVIMMCEERLKWIGVRKFTKAPRNIVALGKPSHWYELHYRVVCENGAQSYQKRAIPINEKGVVLPAKLKGHWMCQAGEADSFVIMASIVEDARRASTMLASVKDATEIKFPVALDAYKEVFSIRDAPMANGRRKAIIHWVSKHLRASTRGGLHDVRKHTRGVKDIVIDGLRINIEPND